MSNIVSYVPQGLNASALPAVFQTAARVDDMEQNIGSSFAVVSIRGKVFRIKYHGQETDITVDHMGQKFAAPFFDVVIPAANPNLSKSYYKSGFQEGSDAQPDCWSEDGIRPGAVTPVHHDCRTCPMNQFGSRINDNGQKAKACSDARRIALLPIQNLSNELFGGPMLLRIPAASLGTLAEYSRALQAQGIPYYAVVTRITFDQSVAYPKLMFQAVRMLSEEEAMQVLQTREGDPVKRVLQSAQATAPQLPAPAPAPVQMAPAPAPVQQYAPPPANVAQFPAPAPAPVPGQVQQFAPPPPAQFVAQPAPAPVQQFAPPPPAQFAPPPPAQFAPAPAPAPTAAPAVPLSGDFLAQVDSLIGG